MPTQQQKTKVKNIIKGYSDTVILESAGMPRDLVFDTHVIGCQLSIGDFVDVFLGVGHHHGRTGLGLIGQACAANCAAAKLRLHEGGCQALKR